MNTDSTYLKDLEEGTEVDIDRAIEEWEPCQEIETLLRQTKERFGNNFRFTKEVLEFSDRLMCIALTYLRPDLDHGCFCYYTTSSRERKERLDNVWDKLKKKEDPVFDPIMIDDPCEYPEIPTSADKEFWHFDLALIYDRKNKTWGSEISCGNHTGTSSEKLSPRDAISSAFLSLKSRLDRLSWFLNGL